MKRKGKASVRTLFVIIILAVSVCAQTTKIADLKWIAGCWEISNAERKLLITEQWMQPAGGVMMGMSRTVRGGKISGFEFLRIVQDDTGINYISKPSQNKEETAFKLIRSSSTEAVFENPTHDFPQRIIYRLDKTMLRARIEGKMNGKDRGIDFPYTRVKCE